MSAIRVPFTVPSMAVSILGLNAATAHSAAPQSKTEPPAFFRMLVANLRASGYQPEQVDAVLLTHLHPDHFGGLADAAQQGYLVGGAHITFPGLGHVSSDERGYHWVQLPYTAP